jgi:hypothetical protein
MRWTDSQLGAIGGLVALVAVALVVIARFRRESRRPGAGREDWEETLAVYKNLRIKGVLEEDEYRKIRSVLDPTGATATLREEGSTNDPAGDAAREDRTTDR